MAFLRRFNDAGYYYWRLAQENLRLVQNADKDKPAPGDREKVVFFILFLEFFFFFFKFDLLFEVRKKKSLILF